MNNISKERIARKLTQEALASRLGWRQSRLSNYETEIRQPNLGDCRRIVAALNQFGGTCTLDSVFPPAENQHIATASLESDS